MGIAFLAIVTAAITSTLGLLFTLVQRNIVEETSQPSRHPPEDTMAHQASGS
jgi:hypothetical protein